MPVDIRKFFDKPTASQSAAASTQSSSAKGSSTATNNSRPTNRASVENDPPPPKKSKGAAASRPNDAKSPPRKKVKRLVIDDDSTEDEEEDDNVKGDDSDDGVVGVVEKPTSARGSSSSYAAAANNNKRKPEGKQRTEISVDDFFADSSQQSAKAPAASKSVANNKPTRSAASPPRKKGRVFDDMDDDDDDDVEDKYEEEEEEEEVVQSPKKPRRGGKQATPTKPAPAKKSVKSPAKKKEVAKPLPPSGPYAGKRPLTSEDLRPGCLNGLTFCFSGVLDTLSRDASIELVKELGGRVTTAVSGKTDYLVVGPILEDGRPYTDGSKYKKAEQNGRTVVVLGEPLFFGLLLRHDARVRAMAGEPSRPEDNEEEEDEPHENSSPASPASAVKPPPPPPSSRDSSASFTAKAPPAEAVASSSNASASKPIVNPYAARKLKSNPYATKKAPPPAPSSPAANLKSEHETDGPPPLSTSNGLLWVDKHKPLNTKQILGNQDCASKLAGWLRTWESKFNVPGAVGKSFGGKQGPWKAALLSGPPGIGKTTTAHLVAREAGRDVIEFNASDVRSKSALQEGLGDITGSRTIEFNVSKSGGAAKPKPRTKRCIIMDEVDGMGGGDRGGIASLIQLIKNSHVPIICICNDRQAQKIRSLVDYCLDLRFRRPTKTQLAKRAVEIAAREGLLVEPNAAEAIAESCGNDVRQVINALQMWNKSSGGDGSRMTYKQLKDRQHEINKDEILRLGLFDATRTILEGRKGLGNSDPKAERDNFYKRDEAFYVDYNFVGLMVQQNYLRVVQNDFSQTVRTKNDDEGVKVLERMSAAADSMSDFDLVSTTIMRAQNWTLLPFSSICAVKTGFHASGPTGSFFPGYPEFTSYLGRNSTKTKKSRLLQEIQYHANYRVSGGTNELRMTYLPAFRDRFLTLLKGDGASGGSDTVSETIDLMDAYGLDRDDVMEKLDEFSMDPKAETFAKIESKKKAAFTRAYNERAHTSQALVSEQLGAIKKSKRGAASSTMSETKDPDVIDEDEVVEEEEEQVDDDDDDAEKIKSLFKPSRKGKSAAASKSGPAKTGAAGKGGRGKAKK